MGVPAFDYHSLSIDERLQLVGDIWDSIADAATETPELLPLTEAQKTDLDQRIAAYDANPAAGVPMDDALENIRARFRQA